MFAGMLPLGFAWTIFFAVSLSFHLSPLFNSAVQLDIGSMYFPVLQLSVKCTVFKHIARTLDGLSSEKKKKKLELLENTDVYVIYTKY